MKLRPGLMVVSFTGRQRDGQVSDSNGQFYLLILCFPNWCVFSSLQPMKKMC